MIEQQQFHTIFVINEFNLTLLGKVYLSLTLLESFLHFR